MEPLTNFELKEQTYASLNRIHRERFASDKEVDCYLNNLKTDRKFLGELRNTILKAVKEGNYYTTLEIPFHDDRMIETIEFSIGSSKAGWVWECIRDSKYTKYIEDLVKLVADVKIISLKRVIKNNCSYMNVVVSWLD